MIVVADSSPVNYLTLIGQESLLPTFFGEVLIPRAVHAELADALAPEPVRDLVSKPPGWLKVVEPLSG